MRKMHEGLVPYLQHHYAISRQRGAGLVFIHIPKTAGSSFREELANVFQPDLNVEIDYASMGSKDRDVEFIRLMEDRLKVVTSDYCYNKYRLVTGHFTIEQMQKHGGLGDRRTVTILRDPVDRLISDFLYRTSEAHPGSNYERLRYPNFATFIEDPINRNVMRLYVAPGNIDNTEDVISYMNENFAFVGTQERYTLSIKILFAFLGMRINPQIKIRQNSGQRSLEIKSEEKLLSLAVNLNREDYAIYNYFDKLLADVSADFYYLSDYDRIFKVLEGMPYPP